MPLKNMSEIKPQVWHSIAVFTFSVLSVKEHCTEVIKKI